MNFIELNEIVDFVSDYEVKTQKIIVKTSSINTIKSSQYCGAQCSLIGLNGDCIYVTETPDVIMLKCNGFEVV